MNQQAMLRKMRQLQKEMLETQKQIEETNIHKKLHRVHIEIEGNKFTVTLIDTENNETIKFR